MAWSTNYPLDSTSVSGSADGIRENFEEIEDWFVQAHMPMGSPNAGAHSIGYIHGVLPLLSSSNIASITSPGTGALVYDTDKGRIFIYSGTAWQPLTGTYFSRVRNVFDEMQVQSGSWTEITTWGSSGSLDLYDSLSEFNNNRFIPKSNGTYLIIYNAMLSCPNCYYQAAIGVFINDILYSIFRKMGYSLLKCDGADIIPFTAGDVVKIAVWQNAGKAATATTGSLYIHRLA